MPKRNIVTLLLCPLLLVLTPRLPSSRAQTPAPEESKLAIMIKTLLSEGTELDLRREQARILLQDPHAHAPLLAALQEDNHLTANIILCRTIATASFPLTDPLPEIFVPALVKNLMSPDAELSFWARHALSRFHSDAVIQGLSLITTDSARPLSARLAALGALELMPGKPPLQAIALLSHDPDPQISNRAQNYLTAVLGLAAGITPQQLEDHCRRQLSQLEESDILRRQLLLQRLAVFRTDTRLADLQQQISFWRERYLAQETAAFNRIAEPTAQLTFLSRFLPSDQPDIFTWALRLLRDWCRTPAARTDPIATQLVELITPFIADPNPRVRELTAGAFELLVAQADPAVPALITQLEKEQHLPTQVALLKALAALETPQAITPALRLLDSPDPTVFTQAARALARIAASQPDALANGQLSQITTAIAAAYTSHPNDQDVTSELIQAMNAIAGAPQNIDAARRDFDEILRTALLDHAGPVRVEAVYTLAQLHQRDVLPLLISADNDLLDDTYTPVRHAVIAAIRDQGGKDHLDHLHQHLTGENDTDVARAVEEAFVAILTRLSTQESYHWAQRLQSAPENQHRLLDKVVAVLAQQIKDAENTDTPAQPEQLRLCLTLQAQTARRDGRASQAAAYLSRLLTVPMPDEQKAIHRREILTLALAANNGPALLAYAAPLMPALLNDPTADALTQIAQVCDKLNSTDQAQRLRRARIVAALVIPVLESIPADQQKNWQARIAELTRHIIDAQLKQLEADPPQEDLEAIKLLTQLDPRLADYPADAPLDQRRTALQDFRKLIQPPSEDTAPEPTEP